MRLNVLLFYIKNHFEFTWEMSHPSLVSSTHLELGPRTHGNVFLRFCIVSSNELVVLDSLENSKQYKNARKRFHVYGAKVGT